MNALKVALKGFGLIIVSLFFTSSVHATPNLAYAFTPSGWSAPVILTTNSASTTYGTNSINSTNNLYVGWAIVNTGTTTASNIVVSIFVDGLVVQQTGGTGFNLPASSETQIPTTGFPIIPIGTLSSGAHNISVTATSGSDSVTYIYFINVAQSPVPTLITPVNGSTGQSENPTFTWSAVPGSTGYRILVATNKADLPTLSTARAAGPSAVINATTTATSYTPTVPICPNTTYYWEVHLFNNGNNTDFGTWSSISNFTTAVSPVGLTIVPTFDSTITSDPQAATIENTIKAAMAVYPRDFSNQVTVNITFKEQTTGLGNNTRPGLTVSYPEYLSALIAHATTTDDTNALANLPNADTNPVNGGELMVLASPLARALGFSDSVSSDGTVFLNTSIMNLSSATNDTTRYSLFTTVSHEVDEVLAFGTLLNGLANGAPPPTGNIEPDDLFRYDASGNRSFNTGVSTVCYFSIDGVTDLAQYNQEQGGDFSDWNSFLGTPTPQVQDAYGTPGSSPVLGVELRCLDILGYSPTHPLAHFTITSSAGSGGSVSPAGIVNHTIGDSQKYTATPNAGNFASQWLVDSVAAQTGGTNFILSNIQAAHTVLVNFLAKTNQTITFGALASHSVGEANIPLLATASSTLPVSFSISSGPATISGTNLTVTGAGTVIVQATQAGSTTFNAATPVPQSFIAYVRPGITLAKTGTNLVFAWPTNVIGYSLLTATNLTPPVTWLTVTPAPVIVNGIYHVTNGITRTNRFFELKK